MTVSLARGRKIFGASGSHHHRRHNISHDRGRDSDSAQTRGHRNRHRSHSTDSSSSSDSSTSSASSVRSTASEPHEIPAPRSHEPPPGGLSERRHSNEHEPWWAKNSNDWINYGPHRGFGGRGGGRGGRGWMGPTHPGWHGSCGGRGWCAPGTPGPSTVPPIPGVGGDPRCGEPWQFPSYHNQKRAWKAEKRAWKDEKRGVKYERRRMKRAMKRERRQRKREARAMGYGEQSVRGDRPWKLIISFHGARRGSG
ncbi:hypothetical protein BDM02DRAFT_2984602 [Thelephora ganbajun]|uniref:Uncharacterized protein n=1 Tax=Thelephora ganbajun TaxID=370292 RepID=A0ACB6ZB13_THEGA|nr:hypothetical protein BDM02DRAFT_2984602 [Thelephora ganbajun]